MISRDCDKRKFIEAVQEREFREIIRMAEGEDREVKSFRLGKKPKLKESPMEVQKWKNRKYSMKEYDKFVGAFLFFMRDGVRPDNISDWDFQLFRPVCQKLVEKGQFRAEVMKLFDNLG